MHERRPLSSQKNGRVEDVLDALKSLAETIASQSFYLALLSVETYPMVVYTNNTTRLDQPHIVL